MALSIFGCGQSSDKSDTNTEPKQGVINDPINGIFVDSRVFGLSYSTKELQSSTDSEGTFHYLEGEDITFYIGNTSLGTIKGTQ